MPGMLVWKFKVGSSIIALLIISVNSHSGAAFHPDTVGLVLDQIELRRLQRMPRTINYLCECKHAMMLSLAPRPHVWSVCL